MIIMFLSLHSRSEPAPFAKGANYGKRFYNFILIGVIPAFGAVFLLSLYILPEGELNPFIF